ncbi:hypothetical protein ACU4GI_47770 [Cupriavidus basilensis]
MGRRKNHFYEFAATLKLNPKRAKLVVLDGQHRLEAMRLLRKNDEQRSIIEGIEIPICIIWAPGAIEGGTFDENMMRDFRELFVRVNSESRRVSGHFIILLKDDSYTAMTMRQFADLWKGMEQPGGWNRLHLLEWNTREDERADVRTRDFSITTLGIVAKALDEHIFRAEAAPSLLNLAEKEVDFMKLDPDFSWNGLSDRTHSGEIDDIVKSQINSYLVPALNILFRRPSPYARLERSLGDAFEKLRIKVDQNNSSFIRLKAILNSYIYSEEEMFEDSARSAYADFKSWISIDAGDRVYFLSVFQQALIRFWLKISAVLRPFGIQADAAANIAVAGLEALCLDPKIKYLGVGNRYTRRTLWRNESVNFGSAWARRAWLDLIGGTLLNAKVRQAMLDSSNIDPESARSLREEIERELEASGREFMANYVSRFSEEIQKETRQSFPEYFQEERANQLRALKVSSKDSDLREFDAAIFERSKARVNDALEELANLLAIKTHDLQLMSDVR